MDILKSITGYSCPNCGSICSEKTLKSRTDAEFNEFPHTHYSWKELHVCAMCETEYILNNGT